MRKAIDKILRFVSKVSVFITVMITLVFIPYGTAVAIYHLLSRDYIVTFIYMIVVILLLNIHSKVVG